MLKLLITQFAKVNPIHHLTILLIVCTSVNVIMELSEIDLSVIEIYAENKLDNSLTITYPPN